MGFLCLISVPPCLRGWILPRVQGFLAAHFVSSCLRVSCFAVDRFCKFVSTFALFRPQKGLNFVHQNLRKPQQNPPSSTLVNPDFFPAPAYPSQARRQTIPAMRKNECVSSWRGVSWTAAGSVAPRRFRADDGLQKFVARACGRRRRRRCALPAQSKTRTDLPSVEITRSVTKGAALSEGMAANTSFAATPAPSSGGPRSGRFRLAIGRACPMLRSPVKNVCESGVNAVTKINNVALIAGQKLPFIVRHD